MTQSVVLSHLVSGLVVLNAKTEFWDAITVLLVSVLDGEQNEFCSAQTVNYPVEQRACTFKFSTYHDLVKQWSYKCILCIVSLLMLLCASLLPPLPCCSLSRLLKSDKLKLRCSQSTSGIKRLMSVEAPFRHWSCDKPEWVWWTCVVSLNVNQMECRCICMSKVTFPVTKEKKNQCQNV